MTIKTGTILICAFNEELRLSETIEEIKKTLKDIPQIQWQILIVDDGSKDNTWKVINKLSKKYSNLSGLKLTRNRGFHIAVSCGINHCITDLLINITADGAEPPEHIKEMIKKAQEGYDVVWGIRKTRQTSLISQVESILAQKIIRKLVTTCRYPKYDIGGGYFLITRNVVNAFNQLSDKQRSVISLITWLGFPTTLVYYLPRRETRPSRFSISKKVNYLINTVYVDSAIPSKLAIYVTLLAIVSMPLIYFYPILYLLLLSLGILVSLGLLAPYIWLILEEVKNRPLYVVAESIGKIKK